MDHSRAYPGISCRCVGGAQKTDGSSESRLLKIEMSTEDVMLRTNRDSFGVFARIRGLPEKADELRRRLLELVSLTLAENGCLSCKLIENWCDSTEYTLLEEWSDEEAHNVHFGTNLIQNAMKLIPSLLSGELDLRRHVLQLNSVKYGTNSYCLAVG
jgi:quinol monooxygenase YgiN